MKFRIELPDEESKENYLFIDESDNHIYLSVGDVDEGIVKWVCLTSKNADGELEAYTNRDLMRNVGKLVPFRGKITLSND